MRSLIALPLLFLSPFFLLCCPPTHNTGLPHQIATSPGILLVLPMASAGLGYSQWVIPNVKSDRGVKWPPAPLICIMVHKSTKHWFPISDNTNAGGHNGKYPHNLVGWDMLTSSQEYFSLETIQWVNWAQLTLELWNAAFKQSPFGLLCDVSQHIFYFFSVHLALWTKQLCGQILQW